MLDMRGGPNYFKLSRQRNYFKRENLMDPQACLQHIIDIFNDPGCYETYDERWAEIDNSMAELWNWINRGGFAPVLKSIGKNNIGKDKFSIANSDLTLFIQNKNWPPKKGRQWFEMILCDEHGNQQKSIDLG